MKIFEYKLYGTQSQFQGIDQGISTTQFIRNKCLRLWIDEAAKPKTSRKSIGRYDFNNYCVELAHGFDWCAKLNSMARQAAAERAWASVANFYNNCKKKIKGKKGYPKFKNNVRSIEYKTSGWKLSEDFKQLTITDKNGIGTLRMKGGYKLQQEHIKKIKRVKLIKRADGYYAQFSVEIPNTEYVGLTDSLIGLDVGLESFYTDSNGNKVENPRFLRKAENRLKLFQRRVSKKKKGSKNRRKAIKRLAKKHLQVSRQRKDFAVKTARCVVKSNDFVALENLQVRNMVKNHKLAKSISDASWNLFATWLKHFGEKFGKMVIAVNPKNTSQKCSDCGKMPTTKKTLDVRKHSCEFCKYEACRDHNAARNILIDALSTAGHAGSNAWGDESSTCLNANLDEQLLSKNQEPLVPFGAGISRL